MENASETAPAWRKTDHVLEGHNPIARLSMLASKFTNEELVQKAGYWPYTAGELHLMTLAVLWWEPDAIFEWGTNVGNSARIFSWITTSFGIPCRIHSIDLPSETEHPENVKELRGYLVHTFRDINLHLGDGVEVAAELHASLRPQRPLFFVDGDHAQATVTRELRRIRGIAPTAPIILDDTYNIFEHGQGPRAAMLEFLQEYPAEYELYECVAGLPGMSLLVHRSTLSGKFTAAPRSLSNFRTVGYSQSGEEGVLLRIMQILGIERGLCCEFGAWDGKHLSNTRRLMELGWRGLMIEGAPSKMDDLLATYPPGSNAVCLCAIVDDGENALPKLAAKVGVTDRFDLVSVDIDGLDYEVFGTFDRFEKPPLVVVIEVHTCHKGDDLKPIPTHLAIGGLGQPLGLFVELGARLGYRLVHFVGTNAVFVHRDAGAQDELPGLNGPEAAAENLESIKPNKSGREYLYLANLGRRSPFYRFDNPLFSAESLGIDADRAEHLEQLADDADF